MIRAFAIVLLVLLGTPALAQPVSFPSVTVGSSHAGPEVNARVYKPPGNGRGLSGIPAFAQAVWVAAFGLVSVQVGTL